MKNKLGLWVHNTQSLLGNVGHIKGLGFEYIVARVTHRLGNQYVPHQPGNLLALQQEAADAGLPLYCWFYAYPTNIQAQIDAVSNALPTPCEHLIVDVEVEWENLSQGAALAHTFAHGLAEAIEHRAQLHLSSFYWLSHHPVPAAAFLSHCQSLMPQVYQVPVAGGLTSVGTAIQRTLADDPALARQSLGGLLIATVNRPSMLKAVSAHMDVFDGANVWLFDGDDGATTVDPGVRGLEAEWAPAIAAYKGALPAPAAAPDDATQPVALAVGAPAPPAPTNAPAPIVLHTDATTPDPSERRVSTDGLNLRSTGDIVPNNIITSLPLGQKVQLVNADPTPFREVTTTKDGDDLRGFVSEKYLRMPATPLREALIQLAIQEWIRFGRGTHKETEPGFSDRIGEYWQKIGLSYTGKNTDEPWSAAFISYIVREAGYGVSFKYAAGHAVYVKDSLARRLANDTSAGFWAWHLDEHKPEIGDLICKGRNHNTDLDLDNLPDAYESHCDLVVEVRDTEIRTIGGNVSNSVSMTTYNLQNGLVTTADHVYAILQNRR